MSDTMVLQMQIVNKVNNFVGCDYRMSGSLKITGHKNLQSRVSVRQCEAHADEQCCPFRRNIV